MTYADKTKPLIESYLFETSGKKGFVYELYNNEWTKNFTRKLLAAQKAKYGTSSKD